MKHILVALGLIFVAASAAASDQGIAAVDQAWVKAMLAGDAAAVAALYAPDAVMYPPDAMEVKGRDAIRKTYEDLFAGMKIHDVKVVPARYETRGDTSMGWGRFALTMVPKGGGDPVSVEGRFTAVAKKIFGKWSYVVDHASAPLPPPPAPEKKSHP
jgi:uncharacterized protein (TIGR02246 family)